MLSTIGVNTAYQNMVNILKVDTADINRTTSNRRDNKVVRELVRPYCIKIRTIIIIDIQIIADLLIVLNY